MTDRQEAKAAAAAEKARAKALRPWYKKKRFIIPLVLVALIAISAVASGGGDDKTDTPSANDSPDVTQAPTPDATSGANYPDKQKDDHVAGANGEVQFTGFTTTAKNFVRGNDPVFQKAIICADVTLVNRDTKSQDYNEFDFKLQTPSGDVKSFELTGQENKLGSGQLVSGGSKSGVVCFDDPGESGQYVMIWKPDAFKADRGIWLFNL